MKLAIDVVSDFACPWCFIGSHRLDQALKGLDGVEAEIVYLPYLLDSKIPPEGADLRERLGKKFGGDVSKIFVRVELEAKKSGIDLDFKKIRRYPSSIPAHTLVRHSHRKGTQRAFARDIFRAYFLEGEDIGVRKILTSIAREHGFDGNEVKAILDDPSELEQTKNDADEMQRQGVTAVPLVIFAQKFAVMGAEPVDAIRARIKDALAADA